MKNLVGINSVSPWHLPPGPRGSCVRYTPLSLRGRKTAGRQENQSIESFVYKLLAQGMGLSGGALAALPQSPGFYPQHWTKQLRFTSFA